MKKFMSDVKKGNKAAIHKLPRNLKKYVVSTLKAKQKSMKFHTKSVEVDQSPTSVGTNAAGVTVPDHSTEQGLDKVITNTHVPAEQSEMQLSHAVTSASPAKSKASTSVVDKYHIKTGKEKIVNRKHDSKNVSRLPVKRTIATEKNYTEDKEHVRKCESTSTQVVSRTNLGVISKGGKHVTAKAAITSNASAIIVPPKVENAVKKSTTIKSDLTEDRKSKHHATSTSTSASVTSETKAKVCKLKIKTV